MIACLDVASAMMDGPGGLVLVEEAIREAIRFRKRIVTIGRELAENTDGEPCSSGSGNRMRSATHSQTRCRCSRMPRRSARD